MATISSSSIISTSKFPSHRPINGPYLPTKPKTILFVPASTKKDSSGSDSENESGSVDKNMIVLRKRIREIEAAERKAPSHWMEWGTDSDNGSGLVDDNMIILRKRIREIEAAERKAPSHWMEWGSDSENGFGLVDKNMIVLRIRIREIEAAERKAPSHWMEWEKKYYTTYEYYVCEFVGLVQSLLMKTRPGLGIGLAVLTAMSIPTSAVLILMHLVKCFFV